MTESTDIYNSSIHEYGTDNINVLGNYTNSSSAETVYSPGCVIYLKANTSAASRMVIPTITFTLGLCGNLIAIFVVWRNQNRSDKQVIYIIHNWEREFRHFNRHRYPILPTPRRQFVNAVACCVMRFVCVSNTKNNTLHTANKLS